MGYDYKSAEHGIPKCVWPSDGELIHNRHTVQSRQSSAFRLPAVTWRESRYAFSPRWRGTCNTLRMARTEGTRSAGQFRRKHLRSTLAERIGHSDTVTMAGPSDSCSTTPPTARYRSAGSPPCSPTPRHPPTSSCFTPTGSTACTGKKAQHSPACQHRAKHETASRPHGHSTADTRPTIAVLVTQPTRAGSRLTGL